MRDRRTVVVTGASSGVGRSAAIKLAGDGWNIIGLGRDRARSHEALIKIRAAATSEASVHMLNGDLSLLSDTARMADEILSMNVPLQALCNNAGGVRNARHITAEGNEATFAGNHLGHFLLTKRLLPLLRKGAKSKKDGTARIVAVSSEGHRQAPAIEWDDLQRMNTWVSGRNYCLAKLCNLLFTHELSRRYTGEGIVANAMHPGEAATNFASHAVPEMKEHMEGLKMISADVGGGTLAWLASAPEAGMVTNGYFFDCAKLEPAPEARDGQAASRLWSESEALLARAGYGDIH